jgi:hypothetical protein
MIIPIAFQRPSAAAGAAAPVPSTEISTPKAAPAIAMITLASSFAAMITSLELPGP